MPGKPYGEFVVSTHAISTANVDRVLGAALVSDRKGRPEWVEVQYETAEPGRFQQIRMDFPNALFLLSCLKSIQLDSGVAFPDDPRA
jgi:hypothetical protein